MFILFTALFIFILFVHQIIYLFVYYWLSSCLFIILFICLGTFHQDANSSDPQYCSVRDSFPNCFLSFSFHYSSSGVMLVLSDKGIATVILGLFVSNFMLFMLIYIVCKVRLTAGFHRVGGVSCSAPQLLPPQFWKLSLIQLRALSFKMFSLDGCPYTTLVGHVVHMIWSVPPRPCPRTTVLYESVNHLCSLDPD